MPVYQETIQKAVSDFFVRNLADEFQEIFEINIIGLELKFSL